MKPKTYNETIEEICRRVRNGRTHAANRKHPASQQWREMVAELTSLAIWMNNGITPVELQKVIRETPC